VTDGSIAITTCKNGHAFVEPHARCPECDGETSGDTTPPHAVIVAETTVRVTPDGEAFRLGMALLSAGAATLCILDDDVTTGVREVVLYRRDGAFHARRHQD
jgi:uncharacterized OB-fold protein